MGWDSLILGQAIELLGGGVTAINPAFAGAVFRLQPGASPGAPQPTTDYVASLILDGERPFGRRASNRTITLPIWITAPNRQILAAAREALESVIDQDIWTMTWTRDPSNGNPGGVALPLILDCFRAQPTVSVFNTLFERQLTGMQVQVTIPALPYGRSDTQVQMAFAAPVPNSPPPPPAPVVLDSFAAISSPVFTQSVQCAVGPFTGCWDPDSFGDPGGQQTPLTYGASFTSPLNLTGMTSMQMWLGLGSRYYTSLEYHGKAAGVSVYLTLTDTSGNTLGFSRAGLRLPVAPVAQNPVFSRVTMRIPQGSTTFAYASVASYNLEIINRHYPVRRLSWVVAYLDALTAYPSTQTVSTVVRGALHTLYGLAGTARSPASLTLQQAPSAGTPTTITATGPGNYTVPALTAWLKVETWGGGGAGAGMTSAGVGAGADGAEYAAETLFAATPGQVIPYIVGAGDTAGASPAGGQDTIFGPAPGGTLQVFANGGNSRPTGSNAAGTVTSGSGNAVEYPGGAGRANPAGTFGGGGGSSGGIATAGLSPIGSGSVVFTTPGTTTWLCPAGVTQIYAETWGAGGGGGSGSGGGGGAGEYRAGFISVTPGNNYTYVVGSGGAGGTSGGAGSAGGLSSFTGNAGAQVLGQPGQGGAGSYFRRGGGGLGGFGGFGTYGFSGGQGGPAYPYTGGGGACAGPGAYGNPGGSPWGATPPFGGGGGGYGSGTQSGAGSPGSNPGGGGGGSYQSGYAGGGGGSGQVRLTYPATTGAPTSVGGAAVNGGGAGGHGGATSGSNGAAGSQPGGGGGGAWSSGSAQTGGAGGAGQLRITPYASQPFKTLICHRPPLGALKTFQPLVSVGGGSDVPNGATQYQMPQPLTGVSADFGGTYTVYLVAALWPWAGTASRNITVTVTQYEQAGGASYSVSTLPVTVTPQQVTNGIITAGVLTLPVKAVAADNMDGYYTVSVTDSISTDRFYDCIFLDTMGQTVVINEPSAGYITYYLDAPDPNVNLAPIMGSQNGRPAAISVMDNAILSGVPLVIEPADADNQLFVYSADGVGYPSVSLAYYPSYFFDRTQ